MYSGTCAFASTFKYLVTSERFGEFLSQLFSILIFEKLVPCGCCWDLWSCRSVSCLYRAAVYLHVGTFFSKLNLFCMQHNPKSKGNKEVQLITPNWEVCLHNLDLCVLIVLCFLTYFLYASPAWQLPIVKGLMVVAVNLSVCHSYQYY